MTNFLSNLFVRHKELLDILVRKELRAKHIGSMFGIFWIFYGALFPLFSYFLIFKFIIKMSPEGLSNEEYLLFLFTGLMPWLFINRIITDSFDLLTKNMDLLKQAMFPFEILTPVMVIETLIISCIQLPLIFILMGLTNSQELSIKLFLIPVYFLLLAVFGFGLSWIFSLLGFFIRDFKEIIISVFRFLIYITPVMYASDSVPEKYRFLFYLNPITYFIDLLRGILIKDTILNPLHLGVVAAFSLLLFFLGAFGMYKAKTTIGDMV